MRERTKRENIKIRKDNARLYPMYKMFSWNLVFYHAIVYIFLTQEKGFSPVDIFFIEAMYGLFKIVLQVPMLYIGDKLNKKKSIVIGNICVSIFVFLIISAQDINTLILANLFCAIGFSLKNISDSNLLYDSVTHRNGKGMFPKIEEKSTLYYFVFDGVTSMFTGFLFLKNGYLPLYVCFAFTILGIIISLFFRDVTEVEKEEVGYFKSLGHTFDFIFHSKRLKALMLYIAIFWGVFSFFNICKQTVLVEIGVTAEYFAMIFSSLTIISGLSLRYIEKIKHRFGNKILGTILLTTIVLLIITSFIINIFPNSNTIIFIVVGIYAIQYIIKVTGSTLIEEYLKNFTTTHNIVKIKSVSELFVSASSFVVCLVSSFILSKTTGVNSLFIAGIVFLLIAINAIIYMKTRIGLKPEQYKRQDIEELSLE